MARNSKESPIKEDGIIWNGGKECGRTEEKQVPFGERGHSKGINRAYVYLKIEQISQKKNYFKWEIGVPLRIFLRTLVKQLPELIIGANICMYLSFSYLRSLFRLPFY